MRWSPIGLIWAAVMFSGCLGSDPSKTAPVRLQILATADVGSDTEVCGCRIKKLGGLSRRARVIEDRIRTFDGPTLVVDAGDVFFRRWSTPPRYRAQARRTAALHADALSRWKVPAMAVGERDLAFGLQTLRSLASRANVTLLSANLISVNGQTRPFASHIIVPVDGLKVGFVGASATLVDDPARQVYAAAGLRALPEGPAVLEAARAARSAGADFVVGLLHIGEARAIDLLDSLPSDSLDFAIVGHDRAVSPLRLNAGRRRGFVQAGERGKWVVAIEAEIRPGAQQVVDDGLLNTHRRQREELDRAIEAARDSSRKERLVRRRARLDQTEHQPSQPGHHLHVDLIEVSEDLDVSPSMQTLYAAYQTELAALADVDVTSGQLHYVGSKACGQCHERAFAHWKKTGHARAWKTMVRTRQTSNLDCVGCHVTGFERAGGPRRLVDLKPFRNVGCEACHGPGSAHAENPEMALDYPDSVPEQVCAECHRIQADQKPFVYTERLRDVLGVGHGSDELTAGQEASRRRRR
ncbi:MAG: multiheme c-type cytochrome [Myxococcota bacterium]